MENYFIVERQGKSIDHAVFNDGSGVAAFQDVMSMSYNEIKSYKDIDMFVAAVMDASNKHFDEDDAQTMITLIGADNVFIWSIIIGPSDNKDEFKYIFVNWKKDGKSYKYAD